MNAAQATGQPITSLHGAQRRHSFETLFGGAVQVWEYRGAGMPRRLWLTVEADIVTSAHWHIRDLVAALRTLRREP